MYLLGSLEVYGSNDAKLIKVLHISAYAITKVKVISDQYILVYDSTNDVFVLNLEKLLEEDIECEEKAVNSLGSSTSGEWNI